MAIEEYLNKPYWVIDILPKQVPADKQMFYIFLKSSDVLITVSGDDTYMTIYNPTEEVLELIGSLACSEGLYIWRK